jgi:hypothetical protein
MVKMSDGVHIEHCCRLHGCKYGDCNCPVVLGKIRQDYLCEWCEFDGVHTHGDLASEILYRNKGEVKKDIAYLFNCIRRSVEGDDIDLDKVIEIMTKHGFEINEDICIVEGE